MAVTIQTRRDDAVDWATANPVLAVGEIGIETDTDKAKYGDGFTAWNDLPYWIDEGAQIPDGTTDGDFLQWNQANDAWESVTVSPSVPDGTADGKTLRWEATQSSWVESSALVISDAAAPNAVVVDASRVGINRVPTAADMQFKGGNNSGFEIGLDTNSGFTDAVRLFSYARDTTTENQMYYRASEHIWQGVSAAERMRIDAAGNVGIGNGSTFPSGTSARLTVGASGASNAIQCVASDNLGGSLFGSVGAGAGLQFYTYSGALGSETYSERMRIESDGSSVFKPDGATERVRFETGESYFNVGTGQCPVVLDTFYSFGNGNYALRVDGGDGTGGKGYIAQAINDGGLSLLAGGTYAGGGPYNIDATATGACDLRLNFGGDGSFQFHSVSGLTAQSGDIGLSERMRIDSTGNLLVGTTTVPTTSQGGWAITNQASTWSRSSVTVNTQTTHLGFMNGNGLVGNINTNGTVTTYSTSSDERLKKNIVDAGSALPVVGAIQVRAFDWKADDTHQDFGFIAQELVDVRPDAVSVGDDDELSWGVDPSKLVPVLVKAIQELHAEVEALKNG